MPRLILCVSQIAYIMGCIELSIVADACAYRHIKVYEGLDGDTMVLYKLGWFSGDDNIPHSKITKPCFLN